GEPSPAVQVHDPPEVPGRIRIGHVRDPAVGTGHNVLPSHKTATRSPIQRLDATKFVQKSWPFPAAVASSNIADGNSAVTIRSVFGPWRSGLGRHYSSSGLIVTSPRSFVSPGLTVTPLPTAPSGWRKYIPLWRPKRYFSPGTIPSIRNLPSLSVRR